MPITVEIKDDLDLEKIRISGQCFRVTHLENDVFRLIAGDKVLFIKEVGNGKFEVSCTPEEWESFWAPYLDLSRNYAAIRKRAQGKNDFIDEAMGYGKGLRILLQDPWEMLITFIISQRKNMPAIASAVELISQRFGDVIDVMSDPSVAEFLVKHGCEDAALDLHSFPRPEQLASASEKDLRDCSLGYRAPYIHETARQVISGDVDLNALAALSDAELFEQLQKAHGVGAKVANCVCLFGFGRTSQVPIDVWIARAIDEECEGVDPFAQYGEDAGVMQQYVFFYMTDRNRKLKGSNKKEES